MNPPLRLVLCAVLVSCTSLWCACSPSNELAPPGESPDTPNGGACQVDQDCPAFGLFFCDTVMSRCMPACRTQEDCMAARRGEYRISQCDTNPLGCRCDDNRCVEALCSADAECEGSGRVCRNGRCERAPEASAVKACQVVPDYVVGRQGTSARFSVLAVDAGGRAVVVPSGVTWMALDESVQGGGVGASSSFELSAATEEARESVRARVGGATCSARVRVLGAVTPGTLRAVVTDEQTGRPLPGAVVVAADARGAVSASVRTDASGVATLAAPTGAGSVSVFHSDFDYLTVAHEGPGGPRDLALPLRRNPADRYGGYKGTFRNLSKSLDMHAGLAGLSSPDGVTDLSASRLTGPARRVSYTTLGGQTREATVPAGAYVVLPGTTLSVTDGSARGLAGVCDEALAGVENPEEAMALGACGTRTAWALGGDIPLKSLPLLSGETMDVGQLLAQTIPMMRTFSSSVVRDVGFGLKATPGVDTGAPDFSDQSHFEEVDHDFAADQSMGLAFPFAVRVPTLPCYLGTWMDNVAVLGVARVPGRGVVPLGMGMAVNTTPADPNTDQQAGLPGPGLVLVRMAPAHHGLEGSPYELMVTASSSANGTTAGSASSVLIHRTLEALPFDPKGGTPLVVKGPFLPVPEGFRYNYAQEPADGLEGRQLRLVSPPASPSLPTTTVLRAVFTNRAKHRWVVLMDVERAAKGLRLPLPPASVEAPTDAFEDRTYLGDLTGSRSPFGMQALVLRRTGTPEGEELDLRGLVEADGVDLEHLGVLTVAWSSLEPAGQPRVPPVSGTCAIAP
ncbi:carboxypeptidase regulatory-like domain-containing protein [Archangium violaceum]|uniref:carboxypeptidase-like regulatory domain-containing protein n=1 Tax=Archangium violaceum TaxID=83451 RepID=UPI00193BBE92|nr:carboxypeptidase-like regulatory domain-containing protein [Archangium violaceum]QRK05843.1 carboxypeptidase regulatory-like domain-containing protein [Archangium violaceum]